MWCIIAPIYRMYSVKRMICLGRSRKKVLLFVALVGIFTVMFIFNYLSPFFYDDYRYACSFATGERITSICQIFESLKSHYYEMNGRLFLHFFAHLFCMFDGLIFDIVNAVMFVLMILLAYYHGVGSLKHMDYKLILLLFFSIWFSAPSFGESFLWLTGSVNYLFSIVFFLIALIPYRLFYKEYNKNKISVNVCLCIVGIFCGFLGGYTNENLSVSFLAVQVVFAICYIINRYKLRIWMLFCFIGNAFGCYAIFSSPSYSKRSEIWGESRSLLSVIKTALLKLPLTAIAIDVYVMIPIILFLIGFTAYMLKKERTKEESKRVLSISVVYVCATLFFGFSTVLCDYFPTRAWSPAIVLMMIAAIVVFSETKLKIEKRSFWIDLCTVLVSVCLLIGSFISAYTDMRDVKVMFDEREQIIGEAVNKGTQIVELEQIKANTKYSEYFQTQGEISEDYWMNEVIAHYYGLNKITVKK